MTYEEWRKTAVACTDIRIIGQGIGDPFEDVEEPVPGVVFATRVVNGDDEDCPSRFKRFDFTGYIQQWDGMWLVQLSNIERQFVNFDQAARYLWDEWVHDECFPDVDWDRPVGWSSGEELIVLDGPSPDGGMEVRAPKEFAIQRRVGSCMVWTSTGVICDLNGDLYPKVVNIKR